ncbi:MAG: hypothetical protein ABI693_06870 [Bryobacteraceae bacterium]
MNGDEFYVGYFAKAPAGLRSLIRRTAITLICLGACLALFLVLAQQPFADSHFEFGINRTYDGILELQPYPVLLQGGSQFLLVAPGKHGAAELAAGLSGRKVKLDGSLVYRGQDRMLEILPGSMQVQSPIAAPPPSIADLGEVTLDGEVVDSKCYLGVMNPGNGKVHRDCASRCISGGIPPAFAVKGEAGARRFLLLAGSDGRTLNREVLDYVAEPLRIHGRLFRSGSLLVLRAEPKDFQR